MTPDSLQLMLILKIKHGLPDDLIGLLYGYPDGDPVNKMLTQVKVVMQSFQCFGQLVLQHPDGAKN